MRTRSLSAIDAEIKKVEEEIAQKQKDLELIYISGRHTLDEQISSGVPPLGRNVGIQKSSTQIVQEKISELQAKRNNLSQEKLLPLGPQLASTSLAATSGVRLPGVGSTASSASSSSSSSSESFSSSKLF
jgi:hypothetical protein